MAKCGRPVVAAQPGMVRVKSFQAAGAGNYVVIKDRASGHDYVYMHMRKRLSVTRGERVRAGDLIGRVGSTGRSSACHLHFEMWKLPGWYKGGKLFNPTPFLKRWDRKR
ncbi:MAG: M23 family metallopeptidase [Gemmatimonadetes bacterium]|nr:M23 family metallopeptidase [Gemmatimonadota bacterium]